MNRSYILNFIAIVVVLFFVSAISNGDPRGNAQVEQVDNVYVFVNCKPTAKYDTVFKFYFTAVSHQQTRPLTNFYKNVVKSAYKKDEGKPFNGILFSSDDGYHYAVKLN